MSRPSGLTSALLKSKFAPPSVASVVPLAGAGGGPGAPASLPDGAAREGKHDRHGACHDLELAHRFPPGSVKTDWLRVTESCKLVNGTGWPPPLGLGMRTPSRAYETKLARKHGSSNAPPRRVSITHRQAHFAVFPRP